MVKVSPGAAGLALNVADSWLMVSEERNWPCKEGCRSKPPGRVTGEGALEQGIHSPNLLELLALCVCVCVQQVCKGWELTHPQQQKVMS